MAKTAPTKKRFVQSLEEFLALPVSTLVFVSYRGDRNSDELKHTYVIRSENDGASSGGFQIAGGRHWDRVHEWAETIEILYSPDAD